MADQWEIVNPNQQNMSPASNDNWQITTPGYEQQGEESLLSSIAQAPLRIGGDVFDAALKGVKEIPSYYEKSKTEIPGFFKTAREHPGHLAMQGLAGSQELINALAQAPRELTGYAEKRLNLLPKGSEEAVRRFSPDDTSQAIKELFDQPKYPGEAMTRGVIRDIPQIAGGLKLATYPLKLTKKGIIKDVINTRNLMQEKYSGTEGLYNALFKEATEKGAKPSVDINKIDIEGLGGNKRIERNYTAIHNLKNKNLSFQDYQDAIKELGKIEREMKTTKELQGTLTNSQDRKLHAATNAKQYVQENMFKNKHGDLIPDLLERHKKVQEGYATEVIPYNIPALSEFERGKASASNVYKELLQDPFYTQRAKHHRINQREMIKNALIAAGLGVPGTKMAYDLFKRTGNNE
jgi:hypothetical protein